MSFLILVAIVFFCFLPLVFWGYIFSYIDSTLANRSRFIFGVIAGMISTIPILYIGQKTEFHLFGLSSLFETIITFQPEKILSFIFRLGLIVLFVGISGAIIGLLQKNFRELLRTTGKNILVFILGLLPFFGVFLLFYVFFKIFPFANFSLSDGEETGKFLLNSFELVLFYYLGIGFIEETSKHFHFLSGKLPSVKNTKEIVLLSVFIALGFSFTENILYLWNILKEYGFSGEIVRIYFFRSCFSLMLHVICSAVLAHTFSLVWYQKSVFAPFSLFLFLSGILVAIVLHSFFDVSLSLGMGFIPFLYFVGGYLYVSSIFYRETTSRELGT